MLYLLVLSYSSSPFPSFFLTDSYCIPQPDDADEGSSPQLNSGYTVCLKKGEFKYLVGHPEDFLEKGTIDVMRTSKWAKTLKTIVVDEAHCAVQWSKDFRKKYRDIEQLRSIFPEASMLALTGTASVKMQRDIVRILNMGNVQVHSAQVDRGNIKYSCEKRPSNSVGVESSYTAVFKPLLQELKERETEFPKTVIYTSLQWCGFGMNLSVKMLSPDQVTLAGVPEVSQYHAHLLPKVSLNHSHLINHGDYVRMNL